mmetsp:Transcript_87881/g.121126  ORF Transcript_87881/g.121126 Transcript_87881/m.121126 type:complete len:210 (+) Transcript_87881:342-971(+)
MPLMTKMFWSKFREDPNIDAKSEKAYQDEQGFLIPLYLFFFCDFFTWFWCLLVTSDNYEFEGIPFLENKINTAGDWFIFVFVWGYMAGINGLVGHELIHKRSFIPKVSGMLTYTKIFYSHFLYEHTSGHHKNIATPKDPATAKLNEDFYTFAVRSAWGGFSNTWVRENSISKRKNPEISFFRMMYINRINWMVFMHGCIAAVIYYVLGL